MKALHVGPRGSRVVDVPDPEPSEGEALVRVVRSGICGTDLELARGYMQFEGVPGHEFVGVLEEAAAPDLLGRRVVGEINVGCGRCAWCGGGLERHCPRRTVLGILGRSGAHAERLVLPVRNLLAVPDDVSDEEAVLVEPLAAALEILEQIRVEPAWNSLVLGDGKLGLLVAFVLSRTVARVVCAGHHAGRLSRLEGVRVTTCLEGELADTMPGRGFDLVAECTGSPTGLAAALRAVRPRGIVVLKSTHHGNATFSPVDVVVPEVTLVGSRCGRFAPAIELLRERAFDVRRLVDATYPLARATEALERAAQREVVSVHVVPTAPSSSRPRLP